MKNDPAHLSGVPIADLSPRSSSTSSIATPGRDSPATLRRRPVANRKLATRSPLQHHLRRTVPAGLQMARDAIDRFPMSFPFTVKPLTATSLVNGTFPTAHNAFNGPGSLNPNQHSSIPELLTAGVKGFSLDLFLTKSGNSTGDIELCHEFCVPGWLRFLVPGNIKFSHVLSQVREYVDSHPDSGPILLNIENRLRDPSAGKLITQDTILKEIFPHFPPKEVLSSPWKNVNHPYDSRIKPAPISDIPPFDMTFDEMKSNGVKLIVAVQGHYSRMISGEKNDLLDKAICSNYGVNLNNFDTARVKTARLLDYNVTSMTKQSDPCDVDDCHLRTSVFEDRSPLGTIGYYLNLLGLNNGILADVPGRIDKDDMDRIRGAGINIAELDNIDANDIRLVDGNIFTYLQNSPLLSVGLAASIALFGPREHPLLKSAVEVLSFALLPKSARIAYKLTDRIAQRTSDTKGCLSPRKQASTPEEREIYTLSDRLIQPASREEIGLLRTKQAPFAKAYEIVKEATKDVAKGEIYLFMLQLGTHFSNVLSTSKHVAPTTMLGSFANTLQNAVWANVVLGPPLHALRNLVTCKSVADGFAEGVDASMLGATNFRRALRESHLREAFFTPPTRTL